MTWNLEFEYDIPDLDLPLIEVRTGLQNYTDKFLKILRRPIKVVEYISILLAGRQGAGKTTFVLWAANKITEHYGSENVNAIRNKYGDLDALMDHIDSKPIQIIFCDDAYGSLPKDLNKKFTRIRHIYEEKLKEADREAGVIYAFYAVQDYFQLEPRIRRTVNATIYKSSTLNPYDKALLKKILGEEGLRRLEEIDKDILIHYKHEARSISIITIQGFTKPGYIVSRLPKNDPFTDVEKSKEVNFDVDIEVPDHQGTGFKLLKRIEDPDFLKILFEEAKNLIGKINVRKFKPHHLEAWGKHYIQGMTQDHIAEEYGITKGALSNSYRNSGWFAVAREELLGYAAELAVKKLYYPNYIWTEGAREKPDLISPSGDQYIEVKLRHRPEPPKLSMLSKEEFENLDKTILVIITYKPRYCRIDFYQPPSKT